MGTVKHKIFGVGQVIQINDNRVVVRFQNDGGERTFAIPQSFQMGFLMAEGDLKLEVDNIISKLEEMKKATEKSKEEQHRETLINSLYKSGTLNMAYSYIYKLLQYNTWSGEQIKNLFDATVGASYGLKILEADDIYTFYRDLLDSDEGKNCSCQSKILIMEQLEYIDSKLDWP